MLTDLSQKKWITVTADSVNQYPDGINQIYQDKLEGMLIKQIFSPTEILNVKQKLESSNLYLQGVKYGEIFGKIIVNTDKDRSEYLNQAKLFRIAIESLFETNFETKIENLFSQISGGRKVEIPKENGQAYTPATIRFTQPGKGGIPPHTGNEFLHNSTYDYLKTIAKVINGISYFIVINKTEQGGELIIYYLSSEQLDKQEVNPENIIKAKKQLEGCPQRQVVPDEGDMVIFRGGNLMHKVADVAGNTSRITIGGFLALSQDDKKIYYWS